MLSIAPLDLPRRSAVWGYGIALISVAGALLSQHLMDLYWRDSAPVSTFLVAVILSSWLAGARPGLLAAALSVLGFNYYYLGLPGSWTDLPPELVRLLSFALVAGYVVWITATERGAAESLRRAHDGLQQTNQALRAENLERRRTEEELRASEAKFRALWERAPAAIFISQGGTIGYANPAAASITGYDAEALPGAKLRDGPYPDLRALLQAREQARRTGNAIPPHCELSLVTRAGEERWLELADGTFELGGQAAVVTMACDITERKRAEAALRKSERVLREAAELGGTGSWEHDLITGEIFSTPQNLRMFFGAFFGDDVKRDPRFEDYAGAVHPEDREGARAYHQRVMDEGGPIDHEYRVVWPDGTVRVLVGRATVVRDGSGRSIRVHGTNVDVTERKRVEEAMRKSERVLREAEELAHTGSWEHDLVRGEFFNSAENLRLFFGDDRSKGARFEDYLEAVHPDDRAYVMGRREQLHQHGGPRDIEFRVVRPDGSVHTLLGRATIVRDASGKTLRAYGTNIDVTERRAAEDAMRQSQQLLNLVLETLPVGVAVVDRAGDIVLTNPASRRIWGQPMISSGAERWVRSPGYWHGSGLKIGPEEWPSVRALRDGRITLNELMDIDAFDGQRKTIEASAAPIRNAEGSIVGAVIVIDEVTERVGAERALHESASRLQHLSRRLLAVQEEERSHLSRELHDEFGQLLATISLHLHAARGLAGQTAQGSLEEAMTLLTRAGAQLRILALELRPRMLETAGLDSTLRWLAEQHQQHTGIATEVAGHANGVSGDLAIACFRVVQEALTNAARHARAQRVWIELALSEGRLELSVRDDGVGFDVPGTLEGAASRGNLGLVGMRERVEILGGTLELHSEPGRGTRISIALPLVASGAKPVRSVA